MDFFDIAKIVIAKIFFTKASIDDIKTTEIKDIEVYFFIGLLSILNIFQIFYYKDLNLLYTLAINLLVFGFFGFFLYFSGQWGMGDAFLLLSIGLLNIFKNLFEILSWLLTTFSVGIVFIFLFSATFSFISEKIFSFSIYSRFSFIFATFSLLYSLLFIFNSNFIVSLIFFLIFLYSSIPFLNDIKNSMIKKIPIGKLKEGDVLVEFKVWRGITKEEIEELKKKKIKYVYVKEGVRYAPTFLFVLILIIFSKIFAATPLNFFLLIDFPFLRLH